MQLPPDLILGQTYQRRELHEKYGGQQQGGISTPREYPFIFLFSSHRGKEYGYDDGWQVDGLYHYTGEGQVGDMSFTRGNKAVRDHALHGKELLLFDTLPDGTRRFMGPMRYVDHYFKDIPDEDGNSRRGIVFRLAPLLPREEISLAPIVTSEEGLGFIRSRQAAIKASSEHPISQKGETTYYERSKTVAKYILERANGFCEACGLPSPFRKKNSSPYLEVHHTQRLSDEGPDDPAYLIACCPTCHKRVHYGYDGDQINKNLAAKACAIEEAISRNRFIVVTAAVLADDKGRVLVVRRGPQGQAAGQWEFPGGKVESGETLEDCLCRELKEELSISIQPKQLAPYMVIDDSTSSTYLRLYTFYGRLNRQVTVRLNVHTEAKWILPAELDPMQLAHPDRKIKERLQKWPTVGWLPT